MSAVAVAGSGTCPVRPDFVYFLFFFLIYSLPPAANVGLLLQVVSNGSIVDVRLVSLEVALFSVK